MCLASCPAGGGVVKGGAPPPMIYQRSASDDAVLQSVDKRSRDRKKKGTDHSVPSEGPTIPSQSLLLALALICTFLFLPFLKPSASEHTFSFVAQRRIQTKMVRLLQRQRQQQQRHPPTAMATSAATPPRVRMCISWRKVFACIICLYTVGLVVTVLTLDRLYPSRRGRHERPRRQNKNPNYHDPLHLIPHDVSRYVQSVQHVVWNEVQDKVQQLPKEVSELVHQVQDEVASLDMAELADEVKSEVENMGNQFKGWVAKGWENLEQAIPYDEVALLTLPVDVLRIQTMENYVQQMHPELDLKLCRRLGKDADLTRISKVSINTTYFHNKPPPQYTTDMLASCHKHDPQKRYYVYNPLEHSRVVCNLKIPGRGFVELPPELWDAPSSSSIEACLHSAHLYPVVPNITGAGLKPTLILDNVDKGAFEETEQECQVPCLWSGFDTLITQRKVFGTPFQFLFSMEGPEYYAELKVQPDSWQHNRFFATTSFSSDIPLPYFSFAEYDIQHGHDPVPYDKAIKGALFLARNCASKNDRELWVEELQKVSSVFRIDSLSDCLRNADPPNGVLIDDKTQLMRQYMFYMSFENQNAQDYVTEKLWGAFVAGVIPIYMGAPNIKDYVPDNSVIAVEDFDTPLALAKHLRKVASDRSLYESYHAWRNQPLPDHFTRKYNITKTHNKCRTCQWAYAKRYGLGWSHERQAVLDLKIPRHACRNGDGMLTWPIREHWFQSAEKFNDTQPASETKPVLCAPTHTVPWEAHASVMQHWERTIHEHDGVIDLRMQPKGHHVATDDEASTRQPLVLEMMLPFDENDETLTYRRAGPSHLEWQNKASRVTLLFSPAHRMPIRLPTPTTIQLMYPRMVRIIVEDLDLFHEGATERPNYFGSTMKRDWDTSLEVFVGK